MQSPAYPADVQHDTASRHPRRSVWPRGHQAGTDAQPHAGKPAKNVLTCTDDTQARRSSAVVLEMIDSKGSVVVGQQGSLDRRSDAVVVPDRGGQGQDALHDADPDPGGGVAAVLFEVELALEGVVDRLNDLA